MIGFKQKQKSESENFRNHSKMQNYISSLKGNENTIQQYSTNNNYQRIDLFNIPLRGKPINIGDRKMDILQRFDYLKLTNENQESSLPNDIAKGKKVNMSLL